MQVFAHHSLTVACALLCYRYASPSLDFDATTVVALLGAAIAFNFFVLANL